MVAFIKPGETVARLKTITFELFAVDGLLASGGASPQFEGPLAPLVAGGAVVEVRNNPGDAWATATGTFAHDANGRFTYVFANAEVAITKNPGEVAVRYTATGFRTATTPVAFYDPEAQATANTATLATITSTLATIASYIDTEVAAIVTATTAIASALVDIGGLLHRNSLLDNITYTGSELSTARLRVFANAAALAAATIGAADNADGEVRRYTLTGTFSAGKLASFKARQVL